MDVYLTKISNFYENKMSSVEKENLFQTLFDAMDDGFQLIELIRDEKGKIEDFRYLEVNPAFEKQTGLKSSQIKGSLARDVLPQIEEYWFDMYETVIRENKSAHYESYNQDTQRWYDLLFIPYHNDKVAVVFTDITERMEAEEALRQAQCELQDYAHNLERLVEERTKQLQDKERLATIGATAGMVGHDIRNPLQAIAGDIYLAKTELDGLPNNQAKEAITENLSSIEENIYYINKIVADLQDFARPLEPIFSQVELEPLIKAALGSKVMPKNIQTSYHIDNSVSTICTDLDLFKRILNNLGINAIQAMPKGGKVTVTVAKHQNNVAISIQDTGEGIPEEVKPKLFKPMVTTKSKGQGFGLAVVKRLTEVLGGTIILESEVGKGTKVTIELPLKGK